MTNAIDKVPADTIMLMTKRLERIFRFADCEPACHACHASIEVGDKFQLATYTPPKNYRGQVMKSRDTMLCTNCDVPKLIREDTRINKIKHTAWRASGGGFSRPSRATNK